MEHKAGFVSILGNPNVGKSTLMNRLVGERLSIITNKSQTTRHRIKGIVNGENYQIVFSDTPGVVKPSYKMQEYMLDFSKSAIVDADIILYVTDTVESIDKNMDFIEKVKASEVPILLVINKVDLSNPEKLDALFDRWKELMPKAEVFPHDTPLLHIHSRRRGLVTRFQGRERPGESETGHGGSLCRRTQKKQHNYEGYDHSRGPDGYPAFLSKPASSQKFLPLYHPG